MAKDGPGVDALVSTSKPFDFGDAPITGGGSITEWVGGSETIDSGKVGSVSPLDVSMVMYFVGGALVLVV